MTIALNTSPLTSGHKDRGIGEYTRVLQDALEMYGKDYTIVPFNGADIPKQATIVHYPFFDIYSRSLHVGRHTTVVTVHDLIPLKYPDKFPSGIRGRINWYFQKQSLKRAHAVITDSVASKNDIHKIAAIPRERIYVVYPGSSYRLLSEAYMNKKDSNNTYNIPHNYILYVGDVNWNKNIPGLIKAFALLRQDKEFDGLHLVLVGKSFANKSLPEVAAIMNAIDEGKVHPFVHMPGYIPDYDLAIIYNKSACYIQPSFDEGFGFPVLEALSCGGIVVAARVPSLVEIGGSAVTYFDPNSSLEMAESISRALKLNRKDRELRVKEGLGRASQFTLKKMAQQTLHVYHTVLEK